MRPIKPITEELFEDFVFNLDNTVDRGLKKYTDPWAKVAQAAIDNMGSERWESVMRSTAIAMLKQLESRGVVVIDEQLKEKDFWSCLRSTSETTNLRAVRRPDGGAFRHGDLPTLRDTPGERGLPEDHDAARVARCACRRGRYRRMRRLCFQVGVRMVELIIYLVVACALGVLVAGSFDDFIHDLKIGFVQDVRRYYAAKFMLSLLIWMAWMVFILCRGLFLH